MPNTIGLKQPFLGLVAALVAVCLSLGLAAQFDPAIFGSWVAQLIMSAIPMQIVIGLVVIASVAVDQIRYKKKRVS